MSPVGIDQEIIRDAINHLNGRQRGREARVARLAAAGAPVSDRDALRRWVSDACDAAHTGVYHAYTVRVSNGCDPDLPTTPNGKIGCRITRVPVQARRVEIGDVIDVDELTGEDVVAEAAYWIVRWGNCGVGFMEPTYDHDSATAEEAEARARAGLLARGDCFATRAEAVAALPAMLAARTARLARK